MIEEDYLGRHYLQIAISPQMESQKGIAWLIMPLEIHIPLSRGMVFTSWRLYLALLAIPNLITNLLLRRLPETPKFVLNSGNEATTLEILKTIYSVNMMKEKDEYPVESVSLDLVDRLSQKQMSESSGPFIKYLRLMVRQTTALFTPPFLLYTIMSCIILFGVVGTYNTVVLWIPEQTRQLMLYAENRPYYNATLCDVMSMHPKHAETARCQVNYDIFLTSLVIGLLQSFFFLIIGLVSHMIRPKILIVFFAILTVGACFTLLFARAFLLTVSSIGTITVLLLTMFPICLSIAVDYFPTSLRSTATSMIMLFGRIGAAVGSQLVGAFFHSHCTTTYWIIINILVGVIILSIFIPTKRM